MDGKTYFVLAITVLTGFVTVFWTVRNIIRKRGVLSYLAPIFLAVMVYMALVTYKYRGSYEYRVTNSDTKALTVAALVVMIDLFVLIVTNAIIARIMDKKHDKLLVESPAAPAEEETKAVAVENVEIVKEENVVEEEPKAEETTENVPEMEEVKEEESKEEKKKLIL